MSNNSNSNNNNNKNKQHYKIKAKIRRGRCLWCGDSQNSLKTCTCFQYTPIGAYGNVCECGHGEIWHHRNNNVVERLNQTPTINTIVSPYINSLKSQLESAEVRERALVQKIREMSQNNDDTYLCSICMCERRDTVFLPCRHAQFCKKCSQKWIETKTECPICRTKIECLLDIII